MTRRLLVLYPRGELADFQNPRGYEGVVHLTLSPTSWRSEFRRTDGQVADQAAAGCWR
jgi:hypothetical protein